MSELTSIANKISPSGSGIDSLCQSRCVDCVLVETLLNKLLVSELTYIANKIAPSGSGVDSVRNNSSVLTLIVERT